MSNSLDVFAGENKQTTKGNASSITYIWITSSLEYINKSTRYGGRLRPINEALTALKQWNQKGNKRVVIYVKSGVYREYLEIGSNRGSCSLLVMASTGQLSPETGMFRIATLPFDLPLLVKSHNLGYIYCTLNLFDDHDMVYMFFYILNK